ncbi:substrate-binding domain-containing protein [Vibrio viridaestus]|uniref:Autoinducer 2-binding periplasmic protein LuxP n=1 Tax=Vibrio viridaestus TaxID=2487322 RepID=A0A3N9TLE6_9VIBR|nr:substrate-binding domain-containing protein [Vibrio viridaestus]RQW64951.1 sugar ABC transporter [Vibrio viridaestus]
MKKLTSIIATAVIAFCTSFSAVSADKEHYKFVMVSHIGSNDANMNWLTLSLKAFEERYPEVTTEYVSTNEFSIQKLIQLTEQVIATNPDGIAIPIVSAQAMEPVLKKAIDKGIPVVAFNIPDGRDADKRIPYLTYVGGDEYLTGYKLAQYAIDQAKEGKIPQPTQVMCGVVDAAHEGLKARCRGVADAMKTIGVNTDELFIGAEPAKARNTMQAYLVRNKKTNYIFAVTSWASPWAYSVADDMGLDPAVDDKGMTIVTVDASPVALEGIRTGKLLATNSQGFWLQGYIPMEWLYWYKTQGLKPSSDILTGPVVVNKDNLDGWIKQVRMIFGDEYDKQNIW